MYCISAIHTHNLTKSYEKIRYSLPIVWYWIQTMYISIEICRHEYTHAHHIHRHTYTHSHARIHAHANICMPKGERWAIVTLVRKWEQVLYNTSLKFVNKALFPACLLPHTHTHTLVRSRLSLSLRSCLSSFHPHAYMNTHTHTLALFHLSIHFALFVVIQCSHTTERESEKNRATTHT